MLVVAGPALALTDNGNTTGDSLGQQWLDLTLTQGMTTAEALAANPGFDVATIAQVSALYYEAGFDTLTETSWNNDNADGAILLFDLMGCTEATCPPAVSNFPQTQGFVINAASPSNDIWGFAGQKNASGVVYRARVFTGSVEGDAGHYLVMIPEPGTALLFGLGLAGLAAHRRRR